MHKIICTVFISVVVCCFVSGALAVMSSTNYRISTSASSSGGAPVSSGNYQTNSTLGQFSPLMDMLSPPGSTNYKLNPGFWYTLEALGDGLSRVIITGLGAYPTEGGYIESFATDYSHEYWIRINWPAYNAANGETRIATGDIDGDGKDEIMVGLGPVSGNSATPGGWFEIFDDDYTPLAWGRVRYSAYNSANGETWPACGDLDGDGTDEIIIGLGTYTAGGGWFEVFKYESGVVSHQAWQRVRWIGYNSANGETRPACGDIDGDGRDEIIIGLGPVSGNSATPGGWFEIFDDNLSHLAWGNIRYSAYNGSNGETWPACGDVDGDGTDEMVVGLGTYIANGGWFEFFDYGSGTVTHKAWQRVRWNIYNSANGETHPTCGDIDGDGDDEILIGLGNGGQGWMEVFDDHSAGYSHMAWPRIPWVAYCSENGETRPAIQVK